MHCRKNIKFDGEKEEDILARFSDLIVDNSSRNKHCDSDSDDPFDNIKSCRNITFSRSKSYINNDIHLDLHPITPHRRRKSSSLSFKENRKDFTPEIIKSRSKKLYPEKNTCVPPRSPFKTRNDPISQLSQHLFSNNLLQVKTAGTVCDISNKSYNLQTEKTYSSTQVSSNTAEAVENNDLSKVFNNTFSKMLNTPFKSISCKHTSTPLNNSSAAEIEQNTANSTNKSTSEVLSRFKMCSLLKVPVGIEERKDLNDSLKVARMEKRSLITESCKPNGCMLNSKEALIHTHSLNMPGASNSKNKLDKTCFLSELNSTVNSPIRYNETIKHTPLSYKLEDRCAALTGVKKLVSSINAANRNMVSSFNKTSLNLTENRPSSDGDDKLIENKPLSDNDDDLPCTQPISSVILHGVVAFVEIYSGRDDRSLGAIDELASLGAKIENNFTKKVTHCFFQEGKMSTYRRAVEWKIPIVSVLWIEACKAALRIIPVKGYEPYGLDKYKEELPLYILKRKIRRPVTDSKIRLKSRKQVNEAHKAVKVTETEQQPYLGSNGETDKLIDALHSVAGDLKKATHQFENLLTSPILQRIGKEPNSNKITSEKPRSIKKQSKKLIFGSASEDETAKQVNEPLNDESSNLTDSNETEIRVSYDSDDLYIYAKKQAAISRCSAPARLLTNRKCKKLLSSQKSIDTIDKKNNLTNSKTKLRPQKVRVGMNEADKQQVEKVSENVPRTRKRKLLMTNEVLSKFSQDSGESTTEMSPKCPYLDSPNKKQKTVPLKNKNVRKALTEVLRVASDCDSDDSLSRAARRESSALFVKKEKKTNPQRSVPTIVCTSLHRSEIEVVASIVSKLGTFVIEGSVSERTTHVVTPCPRRTVNILKGIARGCWILNSQWVYESLEAGRWLPEERYEMTNFSPSVRQARIERQAFGPEFSLEIFQNVGPIYICRATMPPANDLTELIRLCGGTVVSSARAAKVIIGSTAPFSPTGRRPPPIVKEKWVLDCITKLTNLDMYDYFVDDSEP